VRIGLTSRSRRRSSRRGPGRTRAGSAHRRRLS
jgi:hypothetical protein